MNTASRPDLVAVIHRLAMDGAARWQITDAIEANAKAKGERPPTTDEINAAYAECVERWIADAAAPPDEVQAYHLAVRKHLMACAIKINDYPTAARIAADLGKLQDQYDTRRRAALTTPGRDARIARLKGRAVTLRSVP